MNRREVLQYGASAIAASTFVNAAFAQGSTPWKNHLDAYSRTLHWCRTPEEVAQACHDIGNTTIDLTVRTYPGHVLPEKAKTDLVPFVNGLKRNGVTVSMIAMEVADANTPYLEDMLDAASSVGVHHTWWRGLNFDPALTYPQQLDALKPRVEGLAKLLAKYAFKACYHPGGDFTQLLDLCRPFDPRNIAIQYDTGNFGQFNQGTLANQIHEGGPYIGGFVFKDFVIEKLTPEEQAADAAGARGGRGRGGGSPNGWRSRQVPVGTGVLNLPVICEAMKAINFSGPIECQPEWPELGGPNQGLDKLSIPREQVIALLKRDRLTVEAPLAAAGVI